MERVSRPYCWAVAGYILLLAGIVALANLGVAPWVFTLAEVIPYGDKVGHMVLMGLLAFFLNGALCCRTASVFRFRLLTGSLVAYLLVFAEEVSQHWIASRTLDVFDMLFDVVGIYIFGRLALWNARLKNESKLAIDDAGGGGV